MRAVHLIFGLVGLVIALGWYLPAMLWGYQVSKEISAFQSGESMDLSTAIDGPAPLKWLWDPLDLRDTYTLEEINSDRSVDYVLKLPFARVLQPGEAMPDETLKLLYATARAPGLMMSMCPEVLQNVARKCDVGQADVKIDDEGQVTISGRLEYIPSYDFGDPSVVENGDIFRPSMQIVDRGTVEDTPQNRAKVYSNALQMCEVLKATFGNCLVRNINFYPSSGYSDDVVTLRVRATFAIYADKSKYRRNSVDAEVKRVAEQVL